MTRRIVLLLLLGALVAGGLASSPTASATPPPEIAVARTIGAEADAYASEAAPTQTAGSTPRLLVDGSPRRVTFLRFAVPDFGGGRLVSARLRLHVSDVAGAGSTSGGTVLAATDDGWDEATLSWSNRPALDGGSAGSFGPVPRNRWVARDVTRLVRSGEVLTLGIRSSQADDVAYDARGGGLGPRLLLDIDAPPDGIIVSAVGDMVCGAGQVQTPQTCHEMQVSDLLVEDPDLEAFLALGDLQYNTGSLSDFQTYYEPTYGRVKAITHPVIGNHKYLTPNGDGYWDYWGDQAGERYKGWYSFDLGSRWHVVALNSNCSEPDVRCGSRSPQVEWLRDDLAANDRPCVAAVIHHPRWSSGEAPGDNPSVAPFIQVLQAHRAELVLSGHSHNYERFRRQRADGTASANGIRQFVVGTGGRSVDAVTGFERPFSTGSQFRLAGVFGLLRLSLTDQGYWWSFVDENGRVRDSGTDPCH